MAKLTTTPSTFIYATPEIQTHREEIARVA